jgi:quinol monooxygenase YgiN
MSVSVMVAFKCNTGTGGDFLKLLGEALPDTRAFEGCELIEAYTDADNPDTIMLWERWATRENYEAYMAWRQENGMAEMLGPFMSGMPEITHLSPHEV